MRTTIVLNEALVREALKYARATTKKGLVEEALRAFIRQKEAERRAATYRDRVRALEVKLGRFSLGERPLGVLRGGRRRP